MNGESNHLRLVTQYKLRIARRRLADTVRNTFEGKVALIFVLAAPFLMKGMLVKSSLRAASTSRDLALVMLVWAHAAALVALVLGVIGHTARELTVEDKKEPLALYPGGRHGLAAYHVGGLVSRACLGLLFFFYLFFGALIHGLTPRPFLVVPMHLIAHVLVFGACGVLAYRATLRWLERRPSRGRALDVGAGIGSILAFLAMAGSGILLEGLEPTTLARLGVWFDTVAVFYPPLAPLAQPSERLLGPTVWVTAMVVTPVIALSVAGRLVRDPSPLLLGEVESPGGTQLRRQFPDIWAVRRLWHGRRAPLLREGHPPSRHPKPAPLFRPTLVLVGPRNHDASGNMAAPA